MREAALYRAFLLLALLLATALLLAPIWDLWHYAEAAESLRLSLAPARAVAARGGTLDVHVVLSGAAAVTSVPFHVKFDHRLLEFVRAEEPADLRRRRLDPLVMASVEPERPGDLAVGWSIPGSSTGFSGTGRILTLRFRARPRAGGPAALLLDRASARGPRGERLDLLTKDAAIRIH